MRDDFPARPGSLRAGLDYQPVPLRFGTSGRRGEVAHLTQLEVYLNVRAEIEYLQSLPVAQGGIVRGEPFFVAFDLRPSSTRFVEEQQGRGEIAQAAVRAVREGGMEPVILGGLPTPALAYHALQRRRGSIMITGSHIPFDRNGYKTYTARGELRKEDEAPIGAHVERVRKRLYDLPFADAPFDRQGRFKSGHEELPPPDLSARGGYLRRYTDFVGEAGLSGTRILVYEHSAVGRDLLAELLRSLGADVVAAGRSETFVPIDTENLEAEQLDTMQALAAEARATGRSVDAVVSTDGDSDRPLILGAGSAGGEGRLQFFGGDRVGMLVAEFLGSDAVVVPISCNDAVDRGPLRDRLEPKTRIGSPFVIAGMEQAGAKGRRRICGWEANGGFLLGSDFERGGRGLAALPTRDAFLPILGLLLAARERGLPLPALFDRLPKRFSQASLLPHFPRAIGQAIVSRLSPADPGIRAATFTGEGIRLWDAEARPMDAADPAVDALSRTRDRLTAVFNASLGFGAIVKLDFTDGVRIHFGNGDVAHVRASGNADEFRIYGVADSQARADAIVRLGVAEPHGLLRHLERSVAS